MSVDQEADNSSFGESEASSNSPRPADNEESGSDAGGHSDADPFVTTEQRSGDDADAPSESSRLEGDRDEESAGLRRLRRGRGRDDESEDEIRLEPPSDNESRGSARDRLSDDSPKRRRRRVSESGV